MSAATRRSRISVAEAQVVIEKQAETAPVEPRPLALAYGAVLREEIRADRDFPPYDRVTMDGIAVAYSEIQAGRQEFRVAGTQAAGSAPLAIARPTDCVEVMTGAVLPEGCDCVVPVEEIDREGDSVRLRPGAAPRRLQYVHRRGSDFARESVLLRPGMRLDAPEAAVCAATGRSSVSVSADPKIALVATGDELVEVDDLPLPHQVRISNVYALQAMLASWGFHRCERFFVRDDREEAERLLGSLLETFDVLVISGGVSAGRFDYVPKTLERLGVDALFHKVRQRPGLPFWFGIGRLRQAVFALPGNPVSTTTCARRYLIPFLQRRSGMHALAVEHAVLADEVRFDPELTLFLQVEVERAADSRLLAHPRPVSGSGDFAHLAGSDGFLELPESISLFETGTIWPFYRWAPR